jgi:hypothetical protein
VNLKERIRFAKQVLRELGAPDSHNNMVILLTWMAGESHPDDEKQASFNPLSTTKLVGRTDDNPGDDYEYDDYTDRAGRVDASLSAGMSFYNKLTPDSGVMNYENWDQGVAMTVSTLRDGDFRPIKDILLSGSTMLEDFNQDSAVQGALTTWSGGGYTAGLKADPADHGILTALAADLSGAQPEMTWEEAIAATATATTTTPTTTPTGTMPGIWPFGSTSDGPVSTDIKPGFIVQVTPQDEWVSGQSYTPSPTFYYVQPTNSTTSGEGPSVFWQITGMDADQINEIVEGNDNYGETQNWDQATWNAMVAHTFTDGVGTEWQMWRPSAATVNAQGLGPDGFRFDVSGPDEGPQLVTVEEFVQDLAVTLGLMGTAAWTDEGVQAVLARVISEPSLLGQEYLFDLFNDTKFAQNRSGSQEAWDKARGNLIDGKWTGTRGDLVNRLFDGSEGGLVQAWQSYNSMSDDLTTPDIREDQVSLEVRNRLYANAVSIAQGTMTWWTAIESIQDYAGEAGGDNLWKQHNRKVQRQTGQYDVDLDGKAWEIEQFEQQWGLHSPGAEGGMRLGVIDQAREVLSNSMSMADVKQSIMDSANELYPNKPSLVPTYLWAEPWVNAYNGLMPTSAGPAGSAGSMYNTMVNQALRDNTGIEDFEQTLRGTDDWKNSNKGVAGYRQMFDVLGDAFGFAGQRGYGR